MCITQIDTADKQLKATRQFLEEQAAEREQEREEFIKEIEKLKLFIRDKEKERSSFENASKEVSFLLVKFNVTWFSFLCWLKIYSIS